MSRCITLHCLICPQPLYLPPASFLLGRILHPLAQMVPLPLSTLPHWLLSTRTNLTHTAHLYLPPLCQNDGLQEKIALPFRPVSFHLRCHVRECSSPMLMSPRLLESDQDRRVTRHLMIPELVTNATILMSGSLTTGIPHSSAMRRSFYLTSLEMIIGGPY